jgi:multidrug transporter EmrE-like cation transporter
MASFQDVAHVLSLKQTDVSKALTASIIALIFEAVHLYMFKVAFWDILTAVYPRRQL